MSRQIRAGLQSQQNLSIFAENPAMECTAEAAVSVSSAMNNALLC